MCEFAVIRVKPTAYLSALVMQLIITDVANAINVSNLNTPSWFELMRGRVYCFARYSWSSKTLLEWQLAAASLFHRKKKNSAGRSHTHHCAVVEYLSAHLLVLQYGCYYLMLAMLLFLPVFP